MRRSARGARHEPLKTANPGRRPGARCKNKSAFNEREFRQSLDYPQVACPKCVFYELIRRKTGHIYALCHLWGEKNRQQGCGHFLHGSWERLDEILGLTDGKSKNNLDFPNLMRPCDGLDRSQDGQKVAIDSTAIHAYADKSGNKALHIGRAQRPHVREAAAASSRPGSVGALPFYFNHPELDEV